MVRSSARTARRRLSVRIMIPLLLLPTLASAAAAQSVGTVSGTVRDSAGNAIGNVEVRAMSAHMAVRTDSTGVFRFADVPAGVQHFTFRRLGFEAKTLDAEVQSGETAKLSVVLDAVVAELPGMTIEEETRKRALLHDFYDRKSQGFGHFITRDEIDKRNPNQLSDMMRMVPGAVLVPSRIGGTATLRFSRAVGGRDCPPQYWVDGVKTWGLNIDDIMPGDVEGIEIYAGPSIVPAQYNTRDGTTVCGVVLIWTRIPG